MCRCEVYGIRYDTECDWASNRWCSLLRGTTCSLLWIRTVCPRSQEWSGWRRVQRNASDESDQELGFQLLRNSLGVDRSLSEPTLRRIHVLVLCHKPCPGCRMITVFVCWEIVWMFLAIITLLALVSGHIPARTPPIQKWEFRADGTRSVLSPRTRSVSWQPRLRTGQHNYRYVQRKQTAEMDLVVVVRGWSAKGVAQRDLARRADLRGGFAHWAPAAGGHFAPRGPRSAGSGRGSVSDQRRRGGAVGTRQNAQERAISYGSARRARFAPTGTR